MSKFRAMHFAPEGGSPKDHSSAWFGRTSPPMSAASHSRTSFGRLTMTDDEAGLWIVLLTASEPLIKG